MKKLTFIFFAILIIILVGVVIYGFSRTNKMPSYFNDDPNKPVIELTESSFDFGKVNNIDVQNHEFTVKNIGKSDLFLSQITTSCDCTSAYVIQDGNTSPRFNMHINSNWQTSIKPNETVQVKAVYDPKVMPEEGKIERFVIMATNDPNKPKLELKLNIEIVK